MQTPIAINEKYVAATSPEAVSSPAVAIGDEENIPPPPDGGLKAWLFLAAASMTMVITWGFSASFGIFREHYFRSPPYKGDQSVAYIGVLGTGLQLSLSVVLVPYLNRRPAHRKPMLWIGSVLLVGSTLAAAFCRKPLQIIMTQGLLFGIGSGLIFAPCLGHMDGWFIQKRGLANGFFFGASSLAAAIISPVSSLTLAKYGIRNTLLGWSVISAITLALAIPFINPRVPYKAVESTSSRPQSSYAFLRRPVFWILAATTGLQGMGHTLPIVYLPSYATDLMSSTAQGALLITYFQIGCIVGQPAMGAFADRVGPLIPLLLITLGTSSATLLLWGLSTQYWSMILLVLFFGIFSGSFIILRSFFASRIAHDSIKSTDKNVIASQDLLVSSVLLLIRGVTTIASGFAGKAIVELGEQRGVKMGYGRGKWMPLIVYVGAMIGAAGLGAVALVDFRRVRKGGERRLRTLREIAGSRRKERGGDVV